MDVLAGVVRLQCMMVVVVLLLLSITRTYGVKIIRRNDIEVMDVDAGTTAVALPTITPKAQNKKKLLSPRPALVADHHHYGQQSPPQHKRSLSGLPPCDAFEYEVADFHDIHGTSLSQTLGGNGQIIVVNGNFLADSISNIRVDTILVTLNSTTAAPLNTLSIEWYIEDSIIYEYHEIVVAAAEDLDACEPLAVGSCGSAEGRSVCSVAPSGLSAGATYIVRMQSESPEKYQLRLKLCTNDCNWPDPPDFSNWGNCDINSGGGDGGDGGDGVIYHKFKIHPPSFAASVSSGTTLLITGTYPVSLPLSEANLMVNSAYLYGQTVYLLVNGVCSTTVYQGANVQEPLTAGTTGTTVQATFSLNAALIYSTSATDPTTAELQLCHRLSLRGRGARLVVMNRVDTVVTVQLQLSAATFSSVQITTQPFDVNTASAGVITTASVQATLWSPLTGTALAGPLQAGQTLLVRVGDVSSAGLRTKQLVQASLTTSAGKTVVIVQGGVPVASAVDLIGPIDCASPGLSGVCEFALLLPFNDFFDQSYVVQLSGTVRLGLGGAAVRRDMRSRLEELATSSLSSSPPSSSSTLSSGGNDTTFLVREFSASFETVSPEALAGNSAASTPTSGHGDLWSSLIMIAAGFVAGQRLLQLTI